MPAKTEEIARTLSSERPARRRVRLAALAVAIAVVAAALGYWRLAGSRAEAVTYVTEPATRAPLTVTVTATGTVQPTNQVTISSELSGTLAEVDADYNDTVTKGQVLARLDTQKLQAQVASSEASLAAAQARVRQAEATLQEAEANFRTAQELDKRGVTTQTNIVTVTAADERAKAALAVARADQSLAEATLASQKADLAKAVIRSPINGIVLDRKADAGQIVASSLSAPTLFTIAEDLRRMELLVDVDEADIGRVKVGDTATFTVEAYPGRVFPAKITQVRFAPETTEGVVTYKAVLSVDNSALLLRPGMTATATITVNRIADALLVPNAALRYAPPPASATSEGSGRSGLLGLVMPRHRTSNHSGAAGAAGRAVWVLRDGTPQRVAVETGDTDGRLTAIDSGELKAGDRVVIDQSGG